MPVDYTSKCVSSKGGLASLFLLLPAENAGANLRQNKKRRFIR